MLWATLLNGSNEFEVGLQYQLILQMIKKLSSEQDFDEDEFSLTVEDVAGNQPISVNYAKKLLLQTKSFIFDGENWKYNDELYLEKEKISWDQFIELFKKEKVLQSHNSQTDVKKTSIIKGIKWCVNMVQLAQEDNMKGLPAFLRCGEEDSLIGKNVAGTATSDALSLLCNGISYIKDCGIEENLLSSSFDFLIEQILECQCRQEGWDEGGFFPLEDQPEADHPTVDATCLAVMALCDFYAQCIALKENLNIKIKRENSVIENAVLSGLNFLFRMQQPSGSYGIYKYEQEYPDGKNIDMSCTTGSAIPNENCTRMAISTMGTCKGSTIFDATERYDLYDRCNEYISRAYAYMIGHMAEENGCLLWSPYFGNNVKNYPVADVIVSGARVCRSLIPVWWQCEEERGQIKRFYSDFFSFWKQEEKNVQGQIGRYTFKTPKKDKYSVGTYMWQSYPDMIAAFTVLQGYNMFGMTLGKEDWTFLDKAVEHVLEMQHPHGHWNSPQNQPICAVTLAAIELLKEYRLAKGIE